MHIPTMMKRTISILLVMLLFLCGTIVRGEERIAATVNGIPIRESEILRRMNASSVLNRQSAGGSTEQERTARNAALREQALKILIEERVLLDEAEKRGLTADSLREDIEARFRKMVGNVAAYVLESYPNLEGDALMEQVKSLLRTTGASLESYYETAVTASVLGALEAQLMAEAPAPDESALQTAYDALWQEQKTLFDADENAFEAALLNAETVLYRPRALKLIQKAEFLFEEGAMELINQANAVSPENAQAMWADQSARALERAQTAWTALQNGALSFDDLLAQLNASAAVNYYGEGSTRFPAEYASRADAFKAPGDFSTPYPMRNGYAILYYHSDLPQCEKVPFETVRKRLLEDMLQESRRTFLREAKDALIAQAQIEYNEDFEE